MSPPQESSRERRPTRSAGREAGPDARLARLRSASLGPRTKLRLVRGADKAAEGGRPAAQGALESGTRRILAASISAPEEARLAREIPRLVREIRLTQARRLTRSRTGRLWAARVFRGSLATGGVPFALPFRRRGARRPRVVLLVDVSWSVARAAGFFLCIAAEFLRLGRDTRVLAFVDRPVDATERVRRWLGRGRAPRAEARPRPARAGRPGAGIVRNGLSFAQLLDGLVDLNLDAASDYGRALHALTRDGFEGGRRTILVILGDGRSNRFDPLPWALDELARNCRAILWIAPEPAARWGTGDSRLGDYLPYVDVLVEGHDLDGLARGVGEILRRI